MADQSGFGFNEAEILAAASQIQGTQNLSDYQAVNQSLFPLDPMQRLAGGPQATAGGWDKLPNGVLINPALGAQGIIFPTAAEGVDPSEIEGSPQWLIDIQDQWSDKQFNTWRKRLIAKGYNRAVPGGIAEKGGAALDVIEGLRAFYTQKYLNGGKEIAFAPVDQLTREAVRDSVDFVALKEEVKTWGEVPFGDSLDEKTADYFAERMVKKMTQLARKNPEWTFEQVQAGAGLRTQKEFTETPGVKESLQEAEMDEMDESLRETIVSMAQIRNVP